MLNQLQIKRYSHRSQVEFRTLSKICKELYYKYTPSRLTHRRNGSMVKVGKGSRLRNYRSARLAS